MLRFTKALRVATSDLAVDERVRYLRNALRRIAAQTYALRGGARVRLRPGTTDAKVFDEIFIERVYQQLLPSSDVRTIVDLGANIGLSTIALLRAYPNACAVAVEPDAGNYETMLENLQTAGVAERCLAVWGFVGAQPGLARLDDSGNGAWGLRMGERSLDGIPVYTLSGLAVQAHMEQFDLVKCDIEGSERELFEAIASWDYLTAYMVLELHADLYAAEAFEAALDRSGYEWTLHGRFSEDSPLSVIALERHRERGREGRHSKPDSSVANKSTMPPPRSSWPKEAAR